MFESILRDIRYGLRQLKQSPGFTLTAVLSLALGIGANTAIFQMLLLVVGVTAGVLIALWAGRAASALLFGLQPYDPISMGAAIALLTAIAMAASYVPARRAAALEPMVALREE
jgi:ABC-type antimicrobial peptide transport system permease subunit